uniref:SWIM-type domain-containing protein n=1 Tax=Mycena chlorophos TaxID=658473 RepID=A0ABQ0L5E5_MYCCL|nr:predicted protein [Mycena chlorophos]
MGQHQKNSSPSRRRRRRQYYLVTEQSDGTLTCNCSGYTQTGKTCEHTAAVKLQIESGPVSQYEGEISLSVALFAHSPAEVEMRGKRGKAAGGKSRKLLRIKFAIPRRKDSSVNKDVDRFLDQMDTSSVMWEQPAADEGKSGSDNESDGNEAGVEVDDPLVRGSQVSPGRPAAVKPLHPGRTPSKQTKKPLKFSQPPGRKRGHPNSLLPGSPVKGAKRRTNYDEWEDDDKLDDRLQGSPEPQMAEYEALDNRRWTLIGYWMWHNEAKVFAEIANAAPFHPDSYYAELAYYAERIQPTQILFLHNNLEGHWVLLQCDKENPLQVTCFDSFSTHSKIRNADEVTQAVVFISAYLFRVSSSAPPSAQSSEQVELAYHARPLGVQNDGHNCGFWACTFALLLACGVVVHDVAFLERLRVIGMNKIKAHLRKLWFSRYLDVAGIPVAIVDGLLKDLGVDPLSYDSPVFPRPPWITSIMEQHLKSLGLASAPPEPTALEKQALLNISVCILFRRYFLMIT